MSIMSGPYDPRFGKIHLRSGTGTSFSDVRASCQNGTRGGGHAVSQETFLAYSKDWRCSKCEAVYARRQAARLAQKAADAAREADALRA